MILNLTQHKSTPEQQAQGVVDLPEKERGALCDALTFEDVPDRNEINDRAAWITWIAIDYFKRHGIRTDRRAMIGGAPFLMASLESALLAHGIKPVYAFSTRQVVEVHNIDGSVEKKSVFRHIGFVEVSK